jgi:hypothetical protein
MKKISFLLFPLFCFAVVSLVTGCKKDDIIEHTPVVNAGADQTIKLPVDSAILSGSATVADGKIAAYLWSEVSGPNTPLIKTAGAATTTVKNLIAGTYIFQLMALDSSGETGVDMVTVTVNPPAFTLKYLYLRPGAADGRDVMIVNIAGFNSASVNQKVNEPELSVARWTFNAQGGGEGTIRTLIKFIGLSAVPATSIVDSAFLSFYGLPSYKVNPEGNSYYPGSPYIPYGDNKCWLQKVTSDWADNTVTWNTQPATTSTSQVEMAASTSQYNYNATHIDVTSLVKDMVGNPAQNYGFMMRMQTEAIYRNMIFAASWHTDSTVRPKLQVYYKQVQ